MLSVEVVLSRYPSQGEVPVIRRFAHFSAQMAEILGRSLMVMIDACDRFDYPRGGFDEISR